jgi:serine O-acetyltransferase
MTKKQDQNHGFITLVKADAMRWNESLNALNFIGMLLLQHGFQLAFLIRTQQAVSKLPLLGGVLRKILWYFTTILTSCHCSPRATYGKGLYFPHPTGIVIGDGTAIGDNVTIYQNVTLGLKELGTDLYPTLSDGATIYAGAQALGGLKVGNNAKVGGNAVVFKDVPEGATAVGIPARII